MFSLLLLGGCDLPGKPNPENRPRTPNEILGFHELFATNCAGCHGATGEMGPAPPLNDPLFASLITEEALLQVISHGRAGTPMPAFSSVAGGSLTTEQVEILARGIKSEWGGEVEDDAAPPLEASGDADSPGNSERGAEVFARACAGCHGAEGRGADESTADGEELPGGAIHVPAFLALTSDAELRRIIITGRSDLGMPSYAESDGRPADFEPLTTEEVSDLVALLGEWRAGRPAAPPETSAQR